ncbi:MAG: hypothetical protein RBR41_11680 [Desulfovibrio sp.]|uniref:beta strand repeat-containing protein n=1 Tax=Desulfovibrio sp. TaxID=885 RepID=UPI002A362BB3|nr:hypothetical protein [Desulfovibrio sp.]MDY0260309.1 hypothetical protein [Desulfovibrio sp.]
MIISQISRPGPGQITTIHAAASDKIILDFSTQGITLSRDDNALIFTFDDGAVIRLDDFYENYRADNVPEFEADGKLVSGAEFFSALGPDLMPAAGPAPVERSSHSAEYGDSALQGGVDHLDGLDMSVQGVSVADGALQYDFALTAAGDADFGGSPAPTPTPAPEPPLFPSGPFVRAVLYSPGNSSDPVTTPVFFGGNGTSPTAVAPGDIDFAGSAPGARYGVTVSLPAGWSSSWVDVSFNSITGRLEFRLTADGVDEMQRLGLEDESLVDFVHVTVTDRTSGDTFEYNVEVVATDSQIFDSAAHDSKYGGEHLDNIGEFHQGQNNGGSYSVISSMQDDEIIMNETVIGGSSIHASGSADPAQMADDFNTIKLNAGVANTTQDSITHITSADGTLDVAEGVIVQGRGAENVIAMGKGSVHVQNASGDGVSAADGGKNTISGGQVVVDAQGRGLVAENGGSNTVVSSGDVAINSSSTSGSAYGMTAVSGTATVTAANTIKADGRVDVNATGNVASAMYATGAQAANSITATSGDVTVSAAGTGSGYGNGFGYGMNARDSGSNSIITGSGDIKVSGNSASTTSYGMFANSSGSNAAATTSGNVTVSGVGTSGTGMHATTSGTSNAISTESGAVNVSGNAANGNGYGMSATIFGGNSISTENGSVNVSGISKTNDGLGMTAVSSGSNTITTGSGDVAVSGNGASIGSGMAASSGSNTITTASGNVTVTGNAAPSVGHGMYANSIGSSNAINTESGDVTVTGSGKSAYGMYGASSGSNAVSTEGGNVTVSGNSTGPVGSSFGYGMYANAGHNSIATEGGDVTVTGSGKSGYGMHAASSSSNAIETQSGNITVTGQADNYGYGMYASGSGHNVIETQSGFVTVVSNGSGSDIHAVYAIGAGSTNTIKGGLGSSVALESTKEALNAQGGGKNFITGGDVSVQTTASNSKAVYATGSASENSIDALQTVTITSNMHGVSANGGGRNSIKGNDITIEAGNNADAYGVYATGSGTANAITARSGLVTISAGKHALFAEGGGTNTVTGDGGMHVKGLESGLYALGSNSTNTITATGGGIVIEAANSNSYAMRAENKGVNTVIGTESVTLGGGKFGMHAAVDGQNSITGNGVDISATNNALYAHGSNSKNIVNAGNGAATLSADSAVSSFAGAHNIVTGASVDIKGKTNGLFSSNAGSNNTVTTKADGAVSITAGQRAMHVESGGSNRIETVDGNVTVIGQGTGSAIGYGMSAMSGGSNTITTEGGHVSVSGSGGSGFGMVAKGGGVNAIESAINSPLTVTITASANTAEKAIAMWAEGGGSVNRITGHSQAGGTGDSITLNANNGQGIAMQATNGGKNIITTGAGNDSVTINGKVVGDGNEIDLGGGSNTLTLNGAVQPGSLNVVATGGTYTLILQESDVESFADRYGDWLDDIVANNLFSGLSSICFEGWGEGDQSAEELAEFMATFGDTLNTLHDAGVAIEPEALSDYLANPSSASSPAALLAETGAEHHMQDAQDAQHATTGHDASTQETALAAHDGSVLVTGDGSEVAAVSVQPGTTALHADIHAPDDIAQPDFAVGQHAVETAQPLFAFLNAPGADAHVDTSAYEGDAPLHNGYLGSGESQSGNAGVQGEIALTHGDESLDSLFAGIGQQLAENGGHGLWYVESGSVLHEVALVDMSKIIVQGGSGEHAAETSSIIGGYAPMGQNVGSAPTVMDSNQETMDNAAREMATY